MTAFPCARGLISGGFTLAGAVPRTLLSSSRSQLARSFTSACPMRAVSSDTSSSSSSDLSSSLPPSSSTSYSSNPPSSSTSSFDTDSSSFSSSSSPSFSQRDSSSSHGKGDKPPTVSRHEQILQSLRLQGLRVVPASPAYFTRRPTFMDDFTAIQSLAQKYKRLPKLPATEAPPALWKTLSIYRSSVPSEPITESEFQGMITALQSLNRIHPDVMPPEVPDVLNAFKRVVSPYDNVKVPRTLDSLGRALGVGYRKTTVARAWVVEGEGKVLVNSKELHTMFQIPQLRETVLWPLTLTQRSDKYNVWAVVEGGGTTGQSDALAMAIAKALVVHEPGLKPYLRKAGLITRDLREVERKKPGHIKSRKMPTWVKR